MTQIDGRDRPQRDDVELLLGRQVLVGAVRDLGRADQPDEPFVERPARGQLEVLPRRPHRHPGAAGLGPRPGEPDLERFLGNDLVLAQALAGRGLLGNA